MLIYDSLKKDHSDVKSLLARLVQAVSAPEKHDLVATLRHEFVLHARAEQKIFYDTLKAIPETEDLAYEGEEEHELIEALLLELEEIDPETDGWQIKAMGVRETVEHHFEHEEGNLFEHARQVLGPEEAQMMAEAFRSLKQSILVGAVDEIPSESLAAVAKFMPARFAQRFADATRRTPQV
jgi:hemerythrin-like domain-containing protein